MNRNANVLTGLEVGDHFPVLEVTVSPAANERYWTAAGVDHPLLRRGALYPPIAANLTVLLVQQTVGEALLHTEQTLTSRAVGTAGDPLQVAGTVTERVARRGREYAVVTATIAGAAGEPLWESTATFTTARAPAAQPGSGAARPAPDPVPPDARHRTLHLDAAALRAYSRAGNFHSDPDEARRLGMPGLVAQGMQVCGPAYGIVLDEWGEELLASGTFSARFVGMVVENQTVDAAVELGRDGNRARFDVRDDRGRVAAVGTASRVRPSAAPG